MTLAVGVRLGPYEVLGPLGVGGMGEVWRARDSRLDREVAVKVVPERWSDDPERVSWFEREARATAALSHPNVVVIHDVGRHGRTPYLVQELLEGEPLARRIRAGDLTVGRSVALAVQVASGLAAAHEKGIVHRDIKPDNLFLTKDGLLKIVDFGLAMPTAATAAEDATTTAKPAVAREAEAAAGTPAYMAPEQARGAAVDHRADLFALGVVLYEMLAGVRPFSGSSRADLVASILTRDPPPLPASVPRAVQRVVARCLEKRAEDRFGSARDLAYALEAVLESTPARVMAHRQEERRPFPGLAAFTEADAERFFGREEEVAALWRKVSDTSMLALIGPSGAGKTSFVRAGLAAHAPQRWRCLVATPGQAPFAGLARALAPFFAGDVDAVQQLLDFHDPGVGPALVGRWVEGCAGGLVVVDQAEELFTLNDAQTQARFAELLGRLAALPGVSVLLSLRDDFLFRCSSHPPLKPVFLDVTPLLPPEGPALRRALVEPARQAGYSFEDEALVEEMLAAVQGERGALPLLAFAASRLWDERDRERKLLTRSTFEKIGGVSGAIARHAEATLERLGESRVPVVRELLRNLTTAEQTRSVLAWDELLSVFPEEHRGEAEEVLAALVDARLLTSFEVEGPDGGWRHRVEVVHESLLRGWPRLVRWQAQDEEGAVLRDQLRQTARLWDTNGRPDDLLWAGTSFAEYQVWRARYPGGLSAVEEAFASAMVAHAGRRRRRRQVALGAALALTVATAATVAVLWRQSAAETRRAEASNLLALAELQLPEDPTEALALATASLELADSPHARLLALRALETAPPVLELDTGCCFRTPRFRPDGRQVAVGANGTEVRVWSEDGSGPLVLDGNSPGNGPVWPLWAADDLLVTGVHAFGAGTDRLLVWSMPAGELVRTIELGVPTPWWVGPRRLYTMPSETTAAGERVRLESWRLPDGEAEVLDSLSAEELATMPRRAALPGASGWLVARGRELVFHPFGDGGPERVLASYDGDVEMVTENQDESAGVEGVNVFDHGGTLHVWSSVDGQPRRVWEGRYPEGGRGFTTVDSKGHWLYEALWRSQFLKVWDPAGLPGARPLALRRSGTWYMAQAGFHPRGSWCVATTAAVSRLTFWPLARPYPSVVEGFLLGQAYTGVLSFSPDSRWLATHGSNWQTDKKIYLWPVGGGGPPSPRTLTVQEELLHGLSPSGGVAGARWEDVLFDPHGRYLLAVAAGGGAVVVPLDGGASRALPGRLSTEGGALGPWAISPSGARVATTVPAGEGSRSVAVVDLASGRIDSWPLPRPELQPDEARDIFNLDFLDEQALLTAWRGVVRRWNLGAGTSEVVTRTSRRMVVRVVRGSGSALTWDLESGAVEALDVTSGRIQPFAGFASAELLWNMDPSATVFATLNMEEIAVSRGGGEPHLLLGHKGPVANVSVSPDLRWVASVGQDNTLRLWPMPDLSQPSLHTLPRAELVARLHALTNLRAVRDPASTAGWSIVLAPFPGWRQSPAW